MFTISKEIRVAFFRAWPLLLGILMIMVGSGLQGTLLSLRATAEGFSLSLVGVIMSCYYLGFIVGCMVIPKAVISVGHIRVFAAFASLASTTILLHGMFVDSIMWSLMRIVCGFSFAGLFIVAESWLSSISTSKVRGQIFGFYILVNYSGLFIGQYLLKLSSISTIDLFILVSVLISVSMLPVTLANKPAPFTEIPKDVSLMEIFKVSPFAILGVLASGFCGAAFFALFPVYLKNIGATDSVIVTYIGMYILGAAIIPVIAGKISDKLPRRNFMLGVILTACIISLTLFLLEEISVIGVFFLGGAMLCLYSIAVAYVNDNLEEEHMLSASARLIMAHSFGAVAGPICMGLIMNWFGVQAFFLSFFIVFAFTLLYGLWRSFTVTTIAVEDQGEFVPLPARGSYKASDINLD